MGAVRKRCPFLLLVQLVSEYIVAVASSGNAPVSVAFSPSHVHDLVSGHNTTVEVTVSIDGNQEPKSKALFDNYIIKTTNDEIASVVGDTKPLQFVGNSPESKNRQLYQSTFTVRGNFLGKTSVCIQLISADNLLHPNDSVYKEIPPSCRAQNGNVMDVWVIQEKGRVVNHVFLSTLVILIIIANVLMGCELDLKLVLETLKKPIPPLIGLCTQFIAMPLLAYSIASMVFLSKGQQSFALGLFVCGCAPGGGASNYWTLLLDGNVPVSITMTFISTLAAFVAMPGWMWVLGSRFLRGYSSDVHIIMPYTKILSSLLTMVVPLIVGIALTRWKPSIQTKARKVMRPFLIFVLIFLVGFGAAANLYMVKLMTWTAVLGGLLLPWCGFAAGCFASLFTRQTPAVVTAIAIETGIQNTGIAIMLLKFSFPEPDSDISALIPVIAACFTPIPLLFMVGVHEVVKCIKKRRENLSDAEAIKKLSYGDCNLAVGDLLVKEKEEEISNSTRVS